MMFRSPLAFGALLLLTLDLRAAETGAEAGTFFSQNYSPKIYGAEPQNWAAVQDHRGVMYFGNTDGVLEFDGQKWRKIPLPNASTVRSLAVGDDGMVYVGGQREFGFLKPDSSGTLQYVSLMNRVEDKDRAFNDVWTTLNTRQGVVFSSYKRLFRWSPKAGMEVWKHSKDLGLAFLVDGFPYLAKDGDGLYRLAGESLEPVPGGKAFQHSVALRGIFRFAGSIAVATADTLYMQDGEVFKEYRGDASSLLRSSVIYTCFPLSNGDLAIGTWHGGLILLDANGKLLRVIGRDAGVHSS